MKIGIITDCLNKSNLEENLLEVNKTGAEGVQIYATGGEFSPWSLTKEKKAYYKKLLADNGLEVSALCADMGGYGFEIEKDNALRVEKTKAIVDLAVEFGAKVITSHIGVIPGDAGGKKYGVMLSALTECGSYAKSKGVVMAIETGPEKADILKGFLDRTKGGVGVNLDPANFVMVTGQDPVEAVYLLKDYIVHTHAKDGIKLDKNQTAEEVYHAFAVGGVAALNAIKGFKEVAIGTGSVDWTEYLRALKQIGYNGYLTIEREAGDNVIEDISNGVKFIREMLSKIDR